MDELTLLRFWCQPLVIWIGRSPTSNSTKPETHIDTFTAWAGPLLQFRQVEQDAKRLTEQAHSWQRTLKLGFLRTGKEDRTGNRDPRRRTFPLRPEKAHVNKFQIM